MKRVFMLSAIADGTGGATATATANATANVVKFEPTSDKLTELKAAKKAAWDKFRQIEDVDSKEYSDAQTELLKINSDIKAEVANIIALKNAAELAEKRNARVALIDNYDAAVIALSTVNADKKASDADKATAADNVAKAREIIVNELLAKFAGSSTAKLTVQTDKPAGTKGATSAAIREAFIANRAAGMTDTENVKAIIASGHSRGTTGAVVLAYQREIGEKS